jgi:methylenetetrahydrofolate reductase (NADPH)
MKSQGTYKRLFSFEFFPPRTLEAVGKLQTTRDRLAKLKPDFFSVTFGAGGSTRELTFETVQEINKVTGIEAVPHVSCIGTQLTTIREVLNRYQAAGISHILALRGDLPSGTANYGELRYANELVEFIRKETGDTFHIEVAAYPEVHPQAASQQEDLQNFKRKADAGAHGAITQYFYNADAYFRFVDDCERLHINIPITPGIMPIINYTQLMRFSDACGAEIPRWIIKRLRDFGDDRVSIRRFGIDVTTQLCARLLEQGAPGLHFYTMNQAEASEAIWKHLGLDTRQNRQAAVGKR